MATLTVHNGEEKRVLQSAPHETLHDVLTRYGIFHKAPCGGQKLCKNCKVHTSGNFYPPDKQETELLTDDELLQGIRYCCMAVPQGDCEVFLTPENLSEQEPKGQPVSDFSNTNSRGIACGIDIGTTTIAVYLYSCKTGQPLSIVSAQNRQSVFGDDVISRIAAVQTQKAGPLLQQIVTEQIAQLIQKACDKAKASPQNITACTIAANTTMLHLLTGLDPTGIAVAPFTPQSLFGTLYRGSQLNLPLACEVYLIPCISAYVGGDITAGIAACEMDCSGKTTLLIDVGTNGEMALSKDNMIYCLATAAGPAFEGAHIQCGVGGIAGAIRRIDESGYETIDNISPTGICGSGIVDAIAFMLRQEILDESGFLENDFSLAPDTSLVITPRDIREIQLAKAAICAGVIRLMELSSVQPEEIDAVLFAGGFGTHIRAESAAQIGLIPKSLSTKCRGVGNTAGMGAVKTSLSADFRSRLEILPERCRYFELSGDPRFNELFTENMVFES